MNTTNRTNPAKISTESELSAAPRPLYLFSTISASSPPRNPSCCATRLLDFELEPPQPAAGNPLAPVHLRRPLPPSPPPLASPPRCAASRHAHPFFPSSDRRERARPTPSAATSISDEQSPATERPPDTAAAPPTSPRRADHRGEIRTSWSTLERRERRCRRVAAARRRPP